MAKIFVIMGKSASGKDTLYRQLLSDASLHLQNIILYTTRPIRTGEEDGRDYFFTDEEAYVKLRQEGRVIECRTYQTVHGPWRYFTAADEQIDLAGEKDYLMINTLEGYCELVGYFGKEFVVPLYVEVEDGERLFRALSRERTQEHPKYEELCRRFLADSADFSEEKLKMAGIQTRYSNISREECYLALSDTILEFRRNL